MSNSAQIEKLIGVLEKIVYSNEENHYLVGYLRVEDEKSRSITIAGNLPGIQCGETLEVSGQWKNHPKFGLQFTVSEFKSKLPASSYGIRKYLGSGLVKGIGKTYANKIVDFFGEKTLDIISTQSKRLQEIPGIGAQRAKSIKQAWEEQQVFREVMIFLQTHNVSNSQCIRLVKKYGNQTIATLKDNPFLLAREVDGIGFLTADKIAHNLGIPSNSEKRIKAGIFHIIFEASGEGHTCVPYEILLEDTLKLLQLDREEVQPQLLDLINHHELQFPRNEVLQLPKLNTHESIIARTIHGLSKTPSTLPSIKSEIAVEWFENKSFIELAPEQRQSILQALQSKVSIITGGPGTGKTTLLKGIVAILKAKNVKVLLASPTGRAAKRLSEATGGYAQTIHRMLGYDVSKGGFIANESKPLNAEFVIVDEASMLDTALAAHLFRAIPYQAHLLLVGDTDQLPSIGAGNVLSDLIKSRQIPVTRLNYIYRQSKGSRISSVAHGILDNKVNPGKLVDELSEIDPEDEIVFIKSDTPENLVSKIIELLTHRLPEMLPSSYVKDTQLLTPLHKGIAGTHNLNRAIQNALNPGKREVRAGFEVLREGDRIIQTRNNYDKSVFNGDIGKIVSINEEKVSVQVDFDGSVVEYERGEFSEFQLAYAISIHKSQGSEYPIVIIPLLKQHFVMLERNLVYTAVTRGKQRVYLIGQVEAFAMAVRNRKTRDRLTNLIPQLQEIFEKPVN
jgi:exodeoxyribonuclease V alpha subunit